MPNFTAILSNSLLDAGRLHTYIGSEHQIAIAGLDDRFSPLADLAWFWLGDQPLDKTILSRDAAKLLGYNSSDPDGIVMIHIRNTLFDPTDFHQSPIVIKNRDIQEIDCDHVGYVRLAGSVILREFDIHNDHDAPLLHITAKVPCEVFP